MMQIHSISFIIIIAIGSVFINFFESVHGVYDIENPRAWAIKWNGIGRSANSSDHYAKSWRGKEISTLNRKALLDYVKNKSSIEIFRELQTRPKANLSPYGTCMIDQKDGLSAFLVAGMFGTDGSTGYPKNPQTGSGDGYLFMCNTEHKLADLCSYKNVGERVKQTLILAIENDVCTNYDTSVLNKIIPLYEKLELENRLKLHLTAVGLEFRAEKDKNIEWEVVCCIRAPLMYTSSSHKKYSQTCEEKFKGEISNIRVSVKESVGSSYEIITSGSGVLLDDEENISRRYDDAIQAAIDLEDEDSADSLRTMKAEHLQDLHLAASRDTIKITAIVSRLRYLRSQSCDISLEAQIRRLV